MPNLIDSLFVFMLAAFIGFEVIRRVSPLLHTPLMSLTNALDAIAVVGATSNIVGGFLITDRMLKMFKSSGGQKR
jgi:NAD(P) transhydrogenase subunit alpha